MVMTLATIMTLTTMMTLMMIKTLTKMMISTMMTSTEMMTVIFDLSKNGVWIRARQNPIGTLKKSVKYRYTLGFGGKSFHLFITRGRIGQNPSRICDEKTPDANPDTWTETWRVESIKFCGIFYENTFVLQALDPFVKKVKTKLHVLVFASKFLVALWSAFPFHKILNIIIRNWEFIWNV